VNQQENGDHHPCQDPDAPEAPAPENRRRCQAHARCGSQQSGDGGKLDLVQDGELNGSLDPARIGVMLLKGMEDDLFLGTQDDHGRKSGHGQKNGQDAQGDARGPPRRAVRRVRQELLGELAHEQRKSRETGQGIVLEA